MSKICTRDPIYRRRRFPPETIELCVRWYITYRLSYRDLVAMMAEREIAVSHTTIMRWVLRYVPEYEVRWSRFARSPDSSWRMDETAVSVRGGRYYLYRAVDRYGKSVASFLSNERSMEAAHDFFRECVVRPRVPWLAPEEQAAYGFVYALFADVAADEDREQIAWARCARSRGCLT
jgi:transposase-like protein